MVDLKSSKTIYRNQSRMVIIMREEYDIKTLNPRKNPYAKNMKKPITMNVSVSTINYFKSLSEESGIPYQTLMNYYLDECVRQKKKLQFV